MTERSIGQVLWAARGRTRVFGEVGYQLLNAILQAAALDLRYQAILLDELQTALVESAGIKTPEAALALG